MISMFEELGYVWFKCLISGTFGEKGMSTIQCNVVREFLLASVLGSVTLFENTYYLVQYFQSKACLPTR